MCRILYMETKEKTNPRNILYSFAEMAKNSKEYQGHGWGASWWSGDHWDFYWSIQPVWQDDFCTINETNRLLVHARSAFRDQGISIENNMPFSRDQKVFVFNGELHGVKIPVDGRIGAEKIFNFILRFNQKDDLISATHRAVSIIKKRSRYIRAMNFFLADPEKTLVHSLFNEQADYFTLHRYQDENRLIICSEPIEPFKNWQSIPNQTLEEIPRCF